MRRVLMLHSSREGQTVKILRFMEQQLGKEFECELVSLHDEPKVDISSYDKVIVGASIRYGHLNAKLYNFIRENQKALAQSDNAFFCVNLTARKPGKDIPENSAYIKKFLAKSSWQPKKIAVFAGALFYPRYRLFDRVMIRFIMKITGGETDTSKEVEYTDWGKVRAFCDILRA
ncbi:menaquinone-dependent protoporphyrinogen IX dehydrogenase [Parasalinivibrio latis]|uniref:menaquinone-dependent protoporphyrinogen IX dehydrogenase n=1 Tax=Parasalinivibrio latis TaxID=2952610 RepID=UPI0030E1EF2D